MAAFAAKAKHKLFSLSLSKSLDQGPAPKQASEDLLQSEKNAVNRCHSLKESSDSFVEITSGTGDVNFVAEEKLQDKKFDDKGVFEYTVKDTDKLSAVAARFDTTPSILKRINRLTMDFIYPGQVLKIPDKDYVYHPPQKSMASQRKQTANSAAEKDSEEKSSIPYPGHIMRVSVSCNSFGEELGKSANEDSAEDGEHLDQECLERFIKIPCHYLTEHDGLVDGTFLVTPNAVMFDPNLMNDIVRKKGADSFGMMAKMDTVMSVSIYHNAEYINSDKKACKTSVKSNNQEIHQEMLESEENTSTDAHQTKFYIKPGEPPSLNSSERDEIRLSRTKSESSTIIDSKNTLEPNLPRVTGNDIILKVEAKEEAMHLVKSAVLLDPSNLSNPDFAQAIRVEKPHRAKSLNSLPDHSKGPPQIHISQSEASGFKTSECKDSSNKLEDHPVYLRIQICQTSANRAYAAKHVEAYSKRVRPEYWFVIPGNRVDTLYTFFISWTPDETTEVDSFVAVRFLPLLEDLPSANSSDLELVSHQFGLKSLRKDWEIVSDEELRRRKSLVDKEKYTPLPELIGSSIILKDKHLRQLQKVLPLRVEGHPWTMVFSTEANGFSLSTLYRCVKDVESPVLLVLQTTDSMIFGAISSCTFHMSDNFYGTGESFLYTFVDGFKSYPWSGANNFFNKGDHNCLSIGAGEGSYGLWIDGDIYLGRTQNCLTYANDPLTGGQEDFCIKQMEVWSFEGCY